MTAIAGGRAADGLDDHLSAGISAALDEITGAAIGAVGDLVASRAEGPSPAAVRGIKAVAQQLAEQQVAVLLVAADVARDAAVGSSYRIGSRPTEFLVDDSDTGVEVPLERRPGVGRAAPGRDRGAIAGPYRPAGRGTGRRAAAPRVCWLSQGARERCRRAAGPLQTRYRQEALQPGQVSRRLASDVAWCASASGQPAQRGVLVLRSRASGVWVAMK